MKSELTMRARKNMQVQNKNVQDKLGAYEDVPYNGKQFRNSTGGRVKEYINMQ